MKIVRDRTDRILSVDLQSQTSLVAVDIALDSVYVHVDAIPVAEMAGYAHSHVPTYHTQDVVVKGGLPFSFLAAQELLYPENCISTTERRIASSLSFHPSISTSASLGNHKLLA